MSYGKRNWISRCASVTGGKNNDYKAEVYFRILNLQDETICFENGTAEIGKTPVEECEGKNMYKDIIMPFTGNKRKINILSSTVFDFSKLEKLFLRTKRSFVTNLFFRR